MYCMYVHIYLALKLDFGQHSHDTCCVHAQSVSTGLRPSLWSSAGIQVGGALCDSIVYHLLLGSENRQPEKIVDTRSHVLIN